MNEEKTRTATLWAIGDIHGEADKLTALLAALPRQAGDTTVFLGDYIDRGPDSAGVVRRVLSEYDADPEHTILLWGNHEDMAASHFHIPAPSHFTYDAYDWFRNGGVEAVASWDIKVFERFTAPCPPDLARLFSLLQTFYRWPEDPSVLCVHAGILAHEEPENATGETLLWVRDDFLNKPGKPGRLVVHGHTPAKSVRPLPHRLGIDTGAVFGGPLTALELPARRIYQADARGVVTQTDLVPAQ